MMSSGKMFIEWINSRFWVTRKDIVCKNEVLFLVLLSLVFFASACLAHGSVSYQGSENKCLECPGGPGCPGGLGCPGCLGCSKCSKDGEVSKCTPGATESPKDGKVSKCTPGAAESPKDGKVSKCAPSAAERSEDEKVSKCAPSAEASKRKLYISH